MHLETMESMAKATDSSAVEHAGGSQKLGARARVGNPHDGSVP